MLQELRQLLEANGLKVRKDRAGTRLFPGQKIYSYSVVENDSPYIIPLLTLFDDDDMEAARRILRELTRRGYRATQQSCRRI